LSKKNQKITWVLPGSDEKCDDSELSEDEKRKARHLEKLYSKYTGVFE